VTIASFYDALAPWYHAIYADWDASMARQGETLNELVAENWGLGPKIIVDASAGIGTQAIPLAGCGHRVVASDLSARAITRAQTEAAGRELQLPAYRGDMQALPIGTGVVDIVMTCDNSLPHLLTEAAIQRALREFSRCVRPGGGCLVSLRDYPEQPPAPGTREVRSYGMRQLDGRKHELRQIWQWDGPCYDLTFEIRAQNPEQLVLTQRTRYLAIPVDRVAALMEQVGFARVRRVDDAFYQPVIVGSRLEDTGSHQARA
jgi:SAM-dependent methyltransferase